MDISQRIDGSMPPSYPISERNFYSTKYGKIVT